MELDRLQQEKNKITQMANQQLSKQVQTVENHLVQIGDEYSRVNQLSGQAGYVIDKIDREFQEKTRLTQKDIILLFLCTAIQCARQYLLSNDKFRLSAKEGDKLMENIIGKPLKSMTPEWYEILFQPVPYDAIQTGAHVKNTGLGGKTHRYRTLGHDPILGWIFGTANIMTNSLTKFNFETYQVKNMKIIRYYPLGVLGMLEKAGEYAQDDVKLLAASVVRQAIHFGSDMFTKQGLPIPFIMTINNDLAKDMLSKWHIDTWSVLRSAALSSFINQLIFIIHQLFYQEEQDGSRSMYEVRTRKVLSYSNTLATTSNIIVVAFTKKIELLDVGGIIVTLYRLVSDYKFINSIKQEFLEHEFYNLIVGEQYEFMEEKLNV